MKNEGFSLVELAIVLVILGLLTGGVLAGQNLIRAAELRRVVSELKNFQTATTLFREKYFALPGDMRNATTFWGSAGGDGTDNICRDSTSGTSATCNGNGDGQIGGTLEYYRYWQHLANAGLIEGSYSGAPVLPVSGSNTYNDVLGVNVPKSSFKNMGYSIRYMSGPYTWGAIGNFISLANCCHPSGYIEGRAMIPDEAWNTDTKIDDGIPGKGSFVSYGPNGYASGCLIDPAVGNEYNLISTATNCVMFYNIGL